MKKITIPLIILVFAIVSFIGYSVYSTPIVKAIGGISISIGVDNSADLNPEKGNAIVYTSEQDTDYEKLMAVYSLIEQMRLEHNRQGVVAKTNSDEYIKTGKWYLYALRKPELGGNIFWEAMMPLLQEQNRLRDTIKAQWCRQHDVIWMDLSDEEQDSALIEMFGDKEVAKNQATKATYSSLAGLKDISLDSLPTTKITDPTENFTTYDETDENSDIGVTADTITVTTMRRDACSHVEDSKGVGHFGDFEHLVAISLGTFEDYAGFGFWAITNSSYTRAEMNANNDGIIVHSFRDSESVLGLNLRDRTNDNLDEMVISETDYWLTIERASTTGTCKVYDDSGRTSLVGTLSITVGTGTYDNVFGVISWDNATQGQAEASASISYLDLQEVAPDISNTPSSENFSLVSESSTYWAKNGASAPSFPLTAANCTFTVTNNSGAAVDITIKSYDWTGGDGWTLTQSSPGSGEIRFSAYIEGDGSGDNVTMSDNTSYPFISSLADSANKSWELKLETGTFTDGVEKNSTVTLTASLS